MDWFSSFSATDATVKALFSPETYQRYKRLEVRIGPGLGSESSPMVSVLEFIDDRDAAIKAMYDEVVN